MLCWNVYIGNFNSGQIEKYNIFDNWSFYYACVKAKKKYKDDKDGFAKEVRGWLSYLFWAKCEWEIILDHWPDGEFYDLRNNVTRRQLCKMYMDAGLNTDSYCFTDIMMDKEVTIHVYPAHNRFHDKKIDVYDQVINNWDVFIEYLWEHRKELKARK